MSTPTTRSNGGTRGTLTSSDPPGAATPVTLTVESSYVGNMRAGQLLDNRNVTIERGTVGGRYVGGLSLHQSLTGLLGPYQRTARGVYTFSFSSNGAPTSVTGLTSTITDLDTDSGNFIDVVELSGAFTVTSSSPGVGGSATQASPARQQQAGAPLPNSSADGNLTVSYSGPIRSFTLTYWNAVETFDLLVDRAQSIYITDMTFKSRSAY